MRCLLGTEMEQSVEDDEGRAGEKQHHLRVYEVVQVGRLLPVPLQHPDVEPSLMTAHLRSRRGTPNTRPRDPTGCSRSDRK